MSTNPNRSSDDFNTQPFFVVLVVSMVLVVSILGSVAIVYVVYRCVKKNGLPAVNINTNTSFAQPAAMYTVVPDSQIRDATVEKFLKEIAGEKPIRFTAQQLAGFTNNYSARLGAGGFGAVYKGVLPNDLMVAVKRLHGHGGVSSSTSQEQFMAEVGTIGRIYHINLVRLFGFCFGADVRALVYEYMDNGALDSYLFDRSRLAVGVATRRAIALGVARGLRYLHEECRHKIVHYDIKPGNVLLAGDLTPKVADFGLARLVNRGDTHVSVSGMRGTPGYFAPEMWMQAGVTEKCDVYSFGMLLFEIARRRRNLDDGESQQQWFPMVAWSSYEAGHLAEAIESGCEDYAMDNQEKGMVERMCKVAFWCVQQQPQARPPMSAVVRMLEAEADVDAPPVNPFQHLVASPAAALRWTSTDSAQSDNTSRSVGSRQPTEVIIPIGS